MKPQLTPLEESVMRAMDCTDQAILPHLPYILQDFWEIGSDPQVMLQLIQKHLPRGQGPTVLDLGCGKGAVSVRLAQHLQAFCHGIDALPEFIAFAQDKAQELGVASLCTFEVGDMRLRIGELGQYHVIILGAIGTALGNYQETFAWLKPHLRDGGIVLVDDAFIADNSPYAHGQVLRRSELEAQLAQAGMFLDDLVTTEEDPATAELYHEEFQKLSRRCRELAAQYPEQSQLFLDYEQQQKDEYHTMEHHIICGTLVVKVRGS